MYQYEELISTLQICSSFLKQVYTYIYAYVYMYISTTKTCLHLLEHLELSPQKDSFPNPKMAGLMMTGDKFNK